MIPDAMVFWVARLQMGAGLHELVNSAAVPIRGTWRIEMSAETLRALGSV